MRLTGIATWGYLVIILFNLLFWGAVGAVAGHFIAKFW